MQEVVFAEPPEQLVNLDRYPVSRPGSPQWTALTNRCREEYQTQGLSLLPGFIVPDALDALAAEANAVSHNAFFCQESHNVYLKEDCSTSESLRDKPQSTFVGSVPYDCLAEGSALRALYNWDPLKEFIGAVLGKTTFHRFADPLGACSINVFVDGGEHGWHFDESEFTVTLMLQSPDHGGEFEYVPQVRGRADEEEIVTSVLLGDCRRVEVLPFSAGALLLFAGRQTMHRVAPVRGATPRLVPVLCYSELPDQRNSDAVRKLFWGRTEEQHRS